MVLGSKGVGITSEELADKRRDGAVEHHGGGDSAGGGDGEARGVQLVLGVGARLVVVGSCAKLPQESLKPRRTFERQRPARALKQEADGAGAGMAEELAVKPLDSARETIVSVAGGDGEARGVQLVLGVGARLVVVVTCVKVCKESRVSSVEHLNASFPHVPLSKKPMAPTQE
jgi:hypothetical protein